MRTAGLMLGDVREVWPRPASRFGRELASVVDPWLLWPLRKAWEWDFICERAERHGVMHADSHAVGLGVGLEPIAHYFARFCARVLATDLYSDATDWQEARVASLEQVHAAAPFDFPADRLQIANADMRAVPEPDGAFDFVWSCSSIEHVPTLADLAQVIRESWRLLKPGGVAILTTEYVVGEGTYLLPGVNALSAELLEPLVTGARGFEVVGEIDLGFDALTPGNAPAARRYLPPPPDSPGFVTMPQMARLAGVTAIAPVGFTLRKVGDLGPLTFDELSIDPDIRTYTNAVGTLRAGDPAGALAMLSPWAPDVGNPPGGEQLTLHAHRFWVEAAALTNTLTKTELGRIADRLLMHHGRFDPDCADLTAFLCGQHGRWDLAATLEQRISNAPSATGEHAVRAANRALISGNNMDALEPAIADAAHVVADLCLAHERLPAEHWPATAIIENWLAESDKAYFEAELGADGVHLAMNAVIAATLRLAPGSAHAARICSAVRERHGWIVG